MLVNTVSKKTVSLENSSGFWLGVNSISFSQLFQIKTIKSIELNLKINFKPVIIF